MGYLPFCRTHSSLKFAAATILEDTHLKVWFSPQRQGPFVLQACSRHKNRRQLLFKWSSRPGAANVRLER
eukprot:8101627-Pyramimonas_sp.AAC.1